MSYNRRIYVAFAVAILWAAAMFIDIVAFSKLGSAPMHPAVALFGEIAAVLLGVVASVAYMNRPHE